jgi:hypothetical protein
VKELVEAGPADWLALAGRPAAPVEVLDADLATVSSAADKVLRVAAEEPYLFHMEFAAGHDGAQLPAKLNARNALLEARHDLPVRSVAILLKPEADSPKITGRYERRLEGEEPYRVFRYDVIRVWQLSVEKLLTGGVATVPLAPVAAVKEEELPGVLAKVERRFEEQSGKAARELWKTTSILMGLRYEEAFIQVLLQGVRSMEVHSVLHDMLDKERLAVRREVILMLGGKCFGPPNAAIRERPSPECPLRQEVEGTAHRRPPALHRRRRPENGKES